MRQFDVPQFYRSPIISKLKSKRKLLDPRKQDFSPSEIKIGPITFILARHFGFCFGVENAIEKSYKAIAENPGKRIFLLSQMIHNPDVNEDLLAHGLRFLQDTTGKELIPFEELTSDDVVIIPAFGTSIEIEQKLRKIGAEIDQYNTTCPFVEKVWNRSEKLGQEDHTILIHGKVDHEETRATFSHSSKTSPSLVLKNLEEARILSLAIEGKMNQQEFERIFEGKFSKGFSIEKDLTRIGVVNQTTMLATETQEITDFIRGVMTTKFGEEAIKKHMADTRDTLCYATNDNQSSNLKLLNEDADLAVVVGGFNSSNTAHLVEILEQKFNTVFIRSEKDLINTDTIKGFDIHSKNVKTYSNLLPEKSEIRIIITSGASCPDALVEGVMKKITSLYNIAFDQESVLNQLEA